MERYDTGHIVMTIGSKTNNKNKFSIFLHDCGHIVKTITIFITVTEVKNKSIRTIRTKYFYKGINQTIFRLFLERVMEITG